MEHASRFVQRNLFTGFPIFDPEPPSPPSLIHAAFGDTDIRIVMVKGEPWWVLVDVAKVLGYKLASDAARLLRDKEKGMHQTHTPGGIQNVVIVSEAGLYRLIMRSNKPEVERFQDWVCEEVLPTIRKTGTYTVLPSRVNHEVRRLKIDPETASIRCHQFSTNKEQNRKLADSGYKPIHLASWHNTFYFRLLEQKAVGLRKGLGLNSRQTPLDRMELVPLAANLHAKALALQEIRSLGGDNLPIQSQLEIADRVALQFAEVQKNHLQNGYHIDLKDDPKRGRVIGVVPSKLVTIS